MLYIARHETTPLTRIPHSPPLRAGGRCTLHGLNPGGYLCSQWLTVNVAVLPTHNYPLEQVGGARAAALHAELDALRSRLRLPDRQTTGLALAAAPRADAPPPPALASPPSPALASPALRIRTASPPARHRRRLTPSLLGRPDSREAHHLLCPPYQWCETPITSSWVIINTIYNCSSVFSFSRDR